MIYTRITNRLMNDNVIESLLMNRSKLNDLQEQISSGKKVSKVSDNPTDAVDILSSQTSLDQIDSYIKNIDSANSELDVADKTILSVIDSVHRASELTVQASNASNGPAELSAINDEIKQIIDSVKQAGDTQFGSKYIFGGRVTETPPFQSTGTPGEIKYTGTPGTGNYQRQVEISQGITVDLNLPGDEVFGQYYTSSPGPPPVITGNGLINTLTTLSQELSAATPNYDNIRSKIGDLDKDLSTLLDAQAKIGGNMARLDMTKTKLSDDQILFTKSKSGLEDIDLAKSVSDLSFQESTLQASLSVGAKVVQSSLLDYM